MKVTIYGSGYVGLVTGTCLAEVGNDVLCVDIDPRKIGRTAHGAPILPADEALARARRERALLVVAVGERGARDIVRARLAGERLEEGVDFVCAA